MKFRLVLSFLILFIGCNSNNTRYNKETAMFKSYLEHTFEKSIPDDSTSYVLVPSHACLGCIGGILGAGQNLKPNVIIISSEKAILRDHIEENQTPQLLVDRDNEIDELPYHEGNIGQVKCAKGQIYEVSSYEASQMGTLIKTIVK